MSLKSIQHMLYRTIIFTVLCFFLVSCSNRKNDAQLHAVALQIEHDPRAAIDSLENIVDTIFGDSDRHYRDLLLIEARDKAYIRHTSDSLILDVISYYSSHKDYNLYATSLYYGGRVYSDLGDYPMALQYFQSALDLLPEDSPNLQLRGNVLSQIGRLLNSLHLYDQATQYIKNVIQVDSICNDSINWMYDLQLLGINCMNACKYDDATTYFKEARKKACIIAPDDTVTQDMYLAAVMLYKNDLQSALNLIRNVPQQIDSVSRNDALAYAAHIYMLANYPDTAYIYATELINSNWQYNRTSGYQVLLSPSMINFIPSDSLVPYILNYRSLLDDVIEKNGNQQAIFQNTVYNYRIQERKRQKAEQTQQRLQIGMFCVVCVVLLLMLCIFYLKYRNKAHLLQLHEALYNLSKLRQELNRKNTENSIYIGTDNQKALRNRLRQELLSLQQSSKDSSPIQYNIVNHETYQKLKSYVDQEKLITEKNLLWDEIATMVETYSSNFKSRLMLLTNGKLTNDDYHIALLIKCGVTPTQLTKLIGRTKGTISYKRSQLCMKVFDQNLGAKAMDDIIRLL
jgi:hypothetical protein